MAAPKAAALPLGDAPLDRAQSDCSIESGRLQMPAQIEADESLFRSKKAEPLPTWFGLSDLRAKRKTGSLGDDLLFHAVTSKVPSALESLTTGFGMGPGVSSPPESPKEPVFRLLRPNEFLVGLSCQASDTLKTEQNAALSPPYTLLRLSPRPLVQLSSKPYSPYTCCLSTW
jgi:hypothetical protein